MNRALFFTNDGKAIHQDDGAVRHGSPRVMRAAALGHALSFLAGVVVTAGVASYVGAGSRAAVKVAAGSEVIGFLGEEVRIMTLVTPAATVTAQRTRPGGRFSVTTTFADDRPGQHCTASGELGGLLASLTSFVANRQLTTEQLKAEYGHAVGTLSISTGASEGDARLELFTDERQEKLAITYGEVAVEVRGALEPLTTLKAGCARLGLR